MVLVTTLTVIGLLRKATGLLHATLVRLHAEYSALQAITVLMLDSCVTAGAKIRCGSTIRLEHVNTRRNLHSHDFSSPLSNGRYAEVSGFGVAGDGDSGDSWIVECENAQQCQATDKDCHSTGVPSWGRDELVRLRHVVSGKYLRTDHAVRFDQSNCPRCPIVGQQEVNAGQSLDDATLWFAGEGIYMGGGSE
ncbi:hypothetical protein DYB32_008900 [Aphanomyces invadans]|uniref:MIR domain-containing protein n=1 Tax=Aphanomyces invadans TaxID=157072 RepID=A0A3R7CUU0_9STRA|nr:hypothetical protein DYB32_008900 [Aphanomyces invadans]